jgi:hypothetical protein
MNMDKVYLEGDLWYIEDFLTKEELDFFKPFMDDHEGWYTTMRSPYKNILNKFIENEIPRNDDGSTTVATSDHPRITYPILSNPGGVFDRLCEVMPPIYRPHATLQTFKYCTDEEIMRDLPPEEKIMHANSPVDYAMNWHSEWDESSPVAPFKLSLSLYLNDDFEGGVLEFLHKPYKIKPKAGMLVGVPVTKEFTHRVTKITSGNWRHTLYGASWNDKNNIPVSTADDC